MKNTSDFKKETDYQEATTGAKSGRPVFFGVRKPKRSYRLRRWLTHDETLSPYYKHMDEDRVQSEYFGNVFYPESRKEEWTYEKNQAFWAGIIDTRRSLVLVTDINHYDFPSGTPHELIWLKDNGYSFRPNPKDPLQTIAEPPNAPILNPSIGNYSGKNDFYGNKADGNEKYVLEKLISIRKQVLILREALAKEEKRDTHTLLKSSFQRPEQSAANVPAATSTPAERAAIMSENKNIPQEQPEKRPIFSLRPQTRATLERKATTSPVTSEITPEEEAKKTSSQQPPSPSAAQNTLTSTAAQSIVPSRKARKKITVPEPVVTPKPIIRKKSIRDKS